MNLCRSGFLGDICNGIKQGFKEAVTFIADAIIRVVNEIVDAINALVKGKFEESIKIIDIDGDNKISQEELTKMLHARFESP